MPLPPEFAEPAGFQWGEFKNASDANIRYGSVQPAGEPKGTIVIVTGFRELIEKYFEVIRDFTGEGYAVWIMDWHGQGGSDRFLPNPQKMYCKGYDEHIATLDQFATGVVKKSNGPLTLVAHSMGAHIGLRYLNEHKGVFASAVLTSPMCDIKTPGFSGFAARLLAKGAKLVHCLTRYIPGGHDWDLKKDGTFETNELTSDKNRFSVLANIFAANPDLRMGSATFGWVLRTFESIKILANENYLKAIDTPVLMGIAGNDKIVRASASERAASLLRNCTRVDLPDSKHEIWMERNAIRGLWRGHVLNFLKGTPAVPVPKKAPAARPPQPI